MAVISKFIPKNEAEGKVKSLVELFTLEKLKTEN